VIRVLIADDHTLFRLGLKAVIDAEAEIEIAGEARNLDELLQLAARPNYDVVVTDLRMPGSEGVEVLQALKTRWPRLPVLALSVYSEDQYAVRALRAGAAGYVSKSSGAEELVEAIRTVASGRMFVSQALAQILANWLEDLQQVPPHETLSERERAVLCMLASGMSLSEIAGHLALSIKTVSTYKARTLKKLNAATNADLIAYAVRHQLCDR